MLNVVRLYDSFCRTSGSKGLVFRDLKMSFIFDWDDSRNLLNGAVSYHLPTHTLNAEAFSRLMVTLSLTGFFSLTTSLLPK